MKANHGSSKVLGMAAAFLVFFPILFFITLLSRDTASYILQSSGRSFGLQEAQLQKAGNQEIGYRTAADKLLEGLLATGFNESSCYSRQQSIFYRKPSPHKPSTYLIKKLRQYEVLHAKCAPNTDLYRRALQKLKSGIKDEQEEWARTWADPFLGSSWLLPFDFPSIPNGRHENSFGYLLKNKSLNGSGFPNFAYLHLAHDYDFFDKLFFCEEEQLLISKIPWLRMRSDVYFAPLMFLVPSFEDELNKLFPEKEMVFHHLGRYLFHPSNAVWKLILRYYNGYLAGADEKIGIQVRVFDSESPDTHQNVLQQLLSCSQSQALLPELAAQEEKETKSNTDQASRKKAILFTSLSNWYSEEIRNMYWEQPTMSGEIGLGGIRPWILAKPENKTIPNPPCRRAMSMEPCFHSPPSYDCKAKKNADLGSLVPFLQHCEDVPSGLKLVDIDTV